MRERWEGEGEKERSRERDKMISSRRSTHEGDNRYRTSISSLNFFDLLYLQRFSVQSSNISRKGTQPEMERLEGFGGD